MKKHKTSFFTVDFILIFVSLALLIVGVFSIFSTGIDIEGNLTNNVYLRQILFAIIGISLMIVISLSDYHFWGNTIIALYFLSLFLLVLVLFIGKEISSTSRWFSIGGFGIQPAEFSKLTLILMLSYYFNKNKEHIKEFKHFLISSLITLVPAFFVLLQPDLGTAIVFIFIYFMMALIVGINSYYLIFVFLVGIFSISLSLFPLWNKFIQPEDPNFFSSIFLDKSYFTIYFLILSGVFGVSLYGYLSTKNAFYSYFLYLVTALIISSFLAIAVVSIIKPYQAHRLIVFLDSSVDPQGAGWNVRQSILAVGSGGFWGQGYLKGFHSHNKYVPEQVTDFVFSIFAEEWGFIGSLLLFSLYFILFLRIYLIALGTENYFGKVICLGILSLWFAHFAVNVGMVIGIMPVTGLPLPLISYGGSSVLVFFMSLGIVLSVYRY